MTVSELKRILEAEGFRQDVYSLTGGLPNEAYCLENRGYEWAVYYSERGERSGERSAENLGRQAAEGLFWALKHPATPVSAGRESRSETSIHGLVE